MSLIANKNRPALGRGMAALLGNAAPPASASSPGRALLALPSEAIARSTKNPRTRFDDKKLEELAQSIREHGVVEPILVRRENGAYKIVAGERRWRAAQRAGLKEIPAIARDATDREAFELALVENIQRADLTAIEEAMAYEVLATDHNLSHDEIATRVGKDRSTIANALRLLKLPREVREAVQDGELEMGHARALLALEDPNAIRKAAIKVKEQGLSVRAAEALVRSLKAGTKGAERPVERKESAGVRDLTNRLQRRLGAKCRVVQRTNEAGKIEIEYTSLQELDGILAKIGA